MIVYLSFNDLEMYLAKYMRLHPELSREDVAFILHGEFVET